MKNYFVLEKNGREVVRSMIISELIAYLRQNYKAGPVWQAHQAGYHIVEYKKAWRK